MLEPPDEQVDYKVRPKPSVRSNRQVATTLLTAAVVISILAVLLQTWQISSLRSENQNLSATITALQATVEALKTATPQP